MNLQKKKCGKTVSTSSLPSERKLCEMRAGAHARRSLNYPRQDGAHNNCKKT